MTDKFTRGERDIPKANGTFRDTETVGDDRQIHAVVGAISRYN
jgi:hypothetical protein